MTKLNKADFIKIAIALVIVLITGLVVATYATTGTETSIDDVTVIAEAEQTQEESEFDGATGFAVAINGEDILYVATEEDAKAVYEGIVARYQTPGSEVIEVAFAEAFTWQEKEIVTAVEAAEDSTLAETYICKVDEAINYIVNGTSEPVTYTIKGGDNFWDIAMANDMTVTELQEMNPGVTMLHIGDTINLYKTNPFVHVTVKEKVTKTETIAYNVSYTNTDTLYKGQVQVQTPGQAGTKEVVAEITKENGVVTATNVISEEVITEPVTQIALKGTKSIPVMTGSGQIQFPVASVDISSGWGASRSGGKRSHKGIDLRGPKGTSIMAADSGTITQAGWAGGSYGYMITINHGNGVVTKYAHCNSVDVTVGQNVQKGEVIGTIGSTGNATGNVLHFEVVINGVQKNPMNYL